MRALSLKTRISLSLLLAFVLVAGLATMFAKASFHEMELRYALADSQSRVDAAARTAEVRFFALGQAAKAASNEVGAHPAQKILQDLYRAGFPTAVVIGADGSVIGMAEALTNDTLRDMLVAAQPPADYPATVFTYHDGWLIVASRSGDLKTAVVGGMSEGYLSNAFFADALVHPDYAQAILLPSGEVLARSANYDDLRDASLFTRSLDPVTGLDAFVDGRIPADVIAERVDAMTLRFLLSMLVAFGLGGSITILLVAYAFRPLDEITDAARRLGRGEEDLDLKMSGQDELGQLAGVLNQSAAALADARKAEAERATQMRSAAEEFELTVGDLSRSVGEADTPQEVAARLSDGLLRVTSARAVLVREDGVALACASRDDDAMTLDGLDALFKSDPDAWRAVSTRGEQGELVVAVLSDDGGALPAAELRKVEILAAQASVATHRAHAAVALRQANAQKETFLDILSHDLKNPLAVARGRIELIARKNPELAEKTAQVEASLDRATRIIEEAVLLSKLERGAPLERAPIDLAALIEESAASLRPLAAPRGICIDVQAPADARWPANRLVQRAVENLLSNAVKWSPENARVEVRVETVGEACRIHVVDHGPGIPDEDKARLFARFQRVDRSGVKGTGLGLAIALRVVKMHGGEIHIADTPGGGSTFVVELPAASVAAIAAEARP